MNTFKKIASVTLAAATLATTMITASAATQNYSFASTGNTFSRSKNVINGDSIGFRNEVVVSYSKIDNNIKEGNVILSVDFSETAMRYTDTDEVMAGISFDSPYSDLYYELTRECYALEKTMGYGDFENVMVVPDSTLIDNFDITSVSLSAYYEPYTNKASTDKAWLNIDYKVKGHQMYISDSALYVYGANSNRTHSTRFNSDGSTTGTFSYLVNLSAFNNRSKTVELNDEIVGTITVPQVNASSVRYGKACSFKNK